MTGNELWAEVRELLDDALPALDGERGPLQAERLACLIALPAVESEDAVEVVVGALEERGTPAAADLLAAMGRLHPEPLRSAAAAAAERVGGARPAPELELRSVVHLELEDVSVLAADLRADGGAFALSVVSDEDGLRGGLGEAGTPEAVEEALAELEGAEPVYPQVAAEQLRSLLDQAAELAIPADEGLTVDGPLVVYAFGLPPEVWPDLPLRVEGDEPPDEPEPERPVPPRPPRDAARKKAKRKQQKSARRRNR